MDLGKGKKAEWIPQESDGAPFAKMGCPTGGAGLVEQM
jgi:hypothetical protein